MSANNEHPAELYNQLVGAGCLNPRVHSHKHGVYIKTCKKCDARICGHIHCCHYHEKSHSQQFEKPVQRIPFALY